MSDPFDSPELCLKSFVTGKRKDAERLLEQVKEPQLLKDKEYGKTLLHWAAEWGWTDMVKLLTKRYNCDPMSRSINGSIPLHTACYYKGDLDVIHYLIDECKCDPMCKRNDGCTPLHSACSGGNLNVAKYLITQYKCHPMCKDNDGYTPLHAACFNKGYLDVICYLIDECKCDPMCKRNDGETPLHEACGGGNLDVAKYLITQYKCDPMCRDNDGGTPLHEACFDKGDLDVIRYLIDECKCDPMCKRNDGETPLHEACGGGNLEVAKYLITQYKCDPMCKDNVGNTSLHTACHNKGDLDVIRYLIDECKCDPMCKRYDGGTPLHSACGRGNLNVAKYLITQYECDPMCRNIVSETPLHVACRNGHYAVVEYLLCTGNVNPASRNILLMSPSFVVPELTSLFRKFSNLKLCLSVDCYISIFLLGDSGVGKTTLTEVIKQTTNGGFWFGQYRHVSGVELHTAGIIPHRLEHRELGNIILHDLAGQPEYYSSHIAVLENITQGSAAVFIIVVKLSEDAPYRWLSLVKDLSSRCSSNCYVLTVASHADAVEGEVRRQELAQGLEGKISSCLMGKDSGLQNMGVVYLDCRKLDSEQFGVFKGLVSKACQSVQSSLKPKSVPSQDVMYCRMLYLLMEAKGENVYTLDILWRMVRESKDYYLPETKDKLSETLHYLHCTGLIMFINTPGGSWVIFRKQILLAEVNGMLFAPQTFERFRNLSSITGIISKEALCQALTNYDPDMLVEFLLSMKLCDKITQEMIEMTNLSPKDGDSAESELLFFPALMSYYKRPVMSSQNEPFQFGWCLQCSDEHSFFTPRFLHLLILRLAYQYVLPKSSHNDLRCTIWSTGILWNNEYGVKTLVELVDNSQGIILLMSCQEGLEHNMISLRRMVITDVLYIKEEICPSVQAKEYVIDSSQLNYPIDKPSSLVLYDIEGIASCIALTQPCVVSYNRNSQIEHVSKKLSNLFPLEYDRRQDISVFVGRDIEAIRLPGGRKLPSTVLSSPGDILKKHSAAITDLVSDPEQLANYLYSAGLISSTVKDKIVTTTGLSRYKMASIVMNEVERNMSGANVIEKFNKLCEILKKLHTETMEEIVMKMEREILGISHDQ